MFLIDFSHYNRYRVGCNFVSHKLLLLRYKRHSLINLFFFQMKIKGRYFVKSIFLLGRFTMFFLSVIRCYILFCYNLEKSCDRTINKMILKNFIQQLFLKAFLYVILHQCIYYTITLQHFILRELIKSITKCNYGQNSKQRTF